MENLTQDQHESRQAEFVATYGIEPGVAHELCRDDAPFLKLVQHMYLQSMEELRDCKLDEDGKRIQGMAQALWALVNLPQEVDALRALDE